MSNSKSTSLFSTRSIALSAVIAGLYAALTILLAPISYGNIQCRISEAMTLLPVLLPQAIPGLTVGCLIANAAGLASGLTTVWDVIFGTLATLLAALCSYMTRNMTVGKAKLPLVAAVWPVVFNAVIVGLVLTFSFNLPFLLTALEVGVGELVAVVLGILLIVGLRAAHIEKLIDEPHNTRVK